MGEFELTEKQKTYIKRLKDNDFKRINILYGSVRSGKTYISLIGWALWIVTMPKSGKFLMCGKTLKSLEQNCLDTLADLIGEEYFRYSITTKRGELFGRKIYFEGANDSTSEQKIRGLTLYGAYMDEITLTDEGFFKMLLSRLSKPNAKFFGTTNPDSPTHWLKTDFLDRANELDMFVDKYTIDDNTTLSPDFVNSLKKEYSGIYYDRFILGNFVRAEGLVFPQFANETYKYLIEPQSAVIKVAESPDYKIVIGVDFGGNKSKTCFVATALSCDYKYIYVLKDHMVHSDYGFNTENISHDINQDDLNYTIDTNKICVDLYKFVEKIVKEYGSVDYIFCDSASPTMINSVRAYFRDNGKRYSHILPVTKNPVQDRPKAIDKMLNTDRLKVSSDCEILINALKDLVWDKHRENVPEDLNVHNVNDIYDAFCYSWIEFIQRIDYIV